MRQPNFFAMTNLIQNYDWGSFDDLAMLFGIPNLQGVPQAELWMGAHPNGCSLVELGDRISKLSELIATDPVAMLGQSTVKRFGSLPFLLKVMSVKRALSIQVHPNKAQAEAGFARDNAAGLAPQAPNRDYRDNNHKPELVFAITPYQAMNGFRELSVILALFERVDTSALVLLLKAFRADQSEQGLARFFRALLTLEGDTKIRALQDLKCFADHHQEEETFALVSRLFDQYPGDVGLFAPLLLNVLTLQPGEAMYLDACTPHAYICGTGLEIMANSDNVLRAGLTPKHINVDELMACTFFVAKPANKLLLTPRVEGLAQHYDVPVPDFTFSVYDVGEHHLTTQSAEVLFAIDGPLTLLRDGAVPLTLNIGHSAFVPASTGEYRVRCEGRFARASNR